MKTTRFFALTLAVATLLSSCSKEDKTGGKEPAGRSKMTLNIKGETEAPVTGKAAGTPTQAEESTINNFIIYVFKADGSNDIAPKEYTSMPAGGKVSDMEISTDAKEVYVIANTTSNTAVNDQLKAVTKKSDLQAVIGRAFESASATALPTQTSTNLWMSGNNDAAFTPVDGGNVTTTVTLKYVGAKVRITSVTVDPSVSGLTLANVIMLNAGGATSFIPADGKISLIPSFVPTAPVSFYTSGVAMTTFTNKPTIVGRNNEYSYALTGDFSITTGKNQQYFYVFENDGATGTFEGQPTIITLKAMDSEFNDVYYSVFFKSDTDGALGYDNQIIERGKSYDVAMTIKKVGNSDPTIPLLKTTVEVTITPAKWDTKIINKIYE